MKIRAGSLVLKGWAPAFALALVALTLALPQTYFSALAVQGNSNQGSSAPARPKRITPKGNQPAGQTSDGGQPSNSNAQPQPPRAYRVGAPKPDVQMEKAMFIGDKELPPENVEPVGTEITYTTFFTNKGTAPSHNLSIIDPVQDRTDFKLGSVTQDLGTTGLRSTVSYSKDDGEHCDYTPVSGAGGAPEGFDRLVNAVCISFSGDFGYTAPNNAARFSYVGRRR